MTLCMILAPALLALPTTVDTAPTIAAADMPASAWFASSPYAPTPAPLADDGGRSYLRVNAGITTTESSDGPDEEIDFDEGFLAALAFGLRMSSGDDPFNFDLEIEGVWTDQDADDNPAIRDVTVLGGLLNGVANFRLGDQFSLYGGAGIGAAWMDVGTSNDGLESFDDEDGPFLAWQAKAGVMWQFSSGTGLSLGYRFLNIDDAEVDDGVGDSSFDLQTSQHVLELGLTFGI